VRRLVAAFLLTLGP